MKKIIKWSLVVIWMIFIFCMSDMVGEDSQSKSIGIISHIIDIGDKVKDKIENRYMVNAYNIDNNISRETKINNLANRLNYPLRKLMHASEFFILYILIINALGYKYINIFKSAYITLIYAGLDEIHQLFVINRTGCINDVFIDMLFIIISIIIISIIKLYKSKYTCNNN